MPSGRSGRGRPSGEEPLRVPAEDGFLLHRAETDPVREQSDEGDLRGMVEPGPVRPEEDVVRPVGLEEVDERRGRQGVGGVGGVEEQVRRQLPPQDPLSFRMAS